MRTVNVEVEAGTRTREPENDIEREAWAAVDSAWSLLRESAVRSVMLAYKEAAALNGDPNFSDPDRWLADAQAGGSDVESLAELAPDHTESPLLHAGLAAVFAGLVREVQSYAAEGFALAKEESE
jgi:hypothetical protein